MSTLESFAPDTNFWDVNQQFKVANPFKDIHKKDKSKGKKDSSLMMWFVVLCYDRDSKFYRLPVDGEEGKHYVIGEDFCGNRNYYEDNKTTLDECIDAYIRMQYTPMERHLKTWEDLLDKRTRFLESQEYNLETYSDLDKMAIGTKSVSDTMKKVMDDLAKESSKGTAKGGRRKSLND